MYVYILTMKSKLYVPRVIQLACCAEEAHNSISLS
jgi:hypothetical protein